MLPILIALALQTGQVGAGDAELAAPTRVPAVVATHSRTGRHGIEIRTNLIGTGESGTSVEAQGVRVSSKGEGRGGALVYSYWLDERTAIQMSAGVLDLDANVSTSGAGTVVESALLVPILVGVKYQPFRLAESDIVRPFVTAAMGTYVGSTTGASVGATTFVGERRASVFGGRVGGGVDVLLGRYFTLGADAGYRMVSEFASPIGGDTRHSGAEFGFTLGVLLGGGGHR